MLNILWEKQLLYFRNCLTKCSVGKQAGGKCWSTYLTCSEIARSQRVLPARSQRITHIPCPPVSDFPAMFNLEDQWIIQLPFYWQRLIKKVSGSCLLDHPKSWCITKLASVRILKMEADGSLFSCLWHKGHLPHFFS